MGCRVHKAKTGRNVQALEKYQCTYQDLNKIEIANRKKEYDTKLNTVKKTASYIEKAENKFKVLWQVINKERHAKYEVHQENKLCVRKDCTQQFNPTYRLSHLLPAAWVCQRKVNRQPLAQLIEEIKDQRIRTYSDQDAPGFHQSL